MRGVASAAVALRRRRFDVNEQDPLAPRRRVTCSQSAAFDDICPILKVRVVAGPAEMAEPPRLVWINTLRVLSKIHVGVRGVVRSETAGSWQSRRF